MKVRNSFVSNSSSSSFVVIGVRSSKEKLISLLKKQAPEKWAEIIKAAKESGIDINNYVYDFLYDNKECLNVGYLSDDGDYIIGKILADVSDGDGDQINGISLSVPEIEEIVNDISKKTDIPKEEIKFMVGTRAC